MNKILRINMGPKNMPMATEEQLGQYAGYGGRKMTSAIISREVPQRCHPLGADNKLVIAPGLLSGSAASMSGRLSVGCKSPLTGGIKEANSGGQVSQMLARLGYAAIVLEGKPKDDTLYKILINKDGVTLTPANNLKMLGNYDLVEKIKKEHGDKIASLSIGPAGEMKMAAASIACTDMELRPTRHAGRGGVGAVMGAKGVKAIVIDDTGMKNRIPKDPEKFKQANKKFIKGLKKHPVTGEGLPTFGTNVLTAVVNKAGGYPTCNFSSSHFDDADKIGGEALVEIEKKRGGKTLHGCHTGCIIQCSGIYNDKKGNYLTKQPEYETIWAHGGNCGISDMDTIAIIDRLCDDYGLDTIETGAAIGVYMESGNINFGDTKAAVNIVKEIGKGTFLGRIIGNGAAVTGKAFGVEKVPVVKGQSMPAYDPRTVQGIAVTYATSTMGADHTAGYAVAANLLGVGGDTDPLKPEGQVELSRNLQIATAAIDSTGMCLFVAFAILDQPDTFNALMDLIGSFTGQSFTGSDFTKLGKTVLEDERIFNIKAGFTKEHDRLPEYFTNESVAPHNVKFAVPDNALDTVFNW